MMNVCCIENTGLAPSGTVRLLDIREQEQAVSRPRVSPYLARLCDSLPECHVVADPGQYFRTALSIPVPF
jgi:hypothetical protein